MSSVIQYNPDDPVVPNRVTLYLYRANTPDYMDLPNTLINADLSGVLDTVPQEYWKVSNDLVIEMTLGEKSAIDESLKAKTVREQVYRINTYDLTYKIESEIWYDTCVDGTYSGKSLETLYNYSSGSLMSKTENTYYYDGSRASSTLHEFYHDNGKIIEKIREI